jgi:hypothetical protein
MRDEYDPLRSICADAGRLVANRAPTSVTARVNVSCVILAKDIPFRPLETPGRETGFSANLPVAIVSGAADARALRITKAGVDV